MGWLGGRTKRREPRMTNRETRLDLRLSARDRAGGPHSGRGARKGKPQRRRSSGGGKGRGPVRRFLYWMFVLALWGGFALSGLIAWQFTKLPPIQTLVIPKRPPTITIVGLDNKVIAVRGEMAGKELPLGALPKYLPQAFVAIEDRRFYYHFGIDPIGIARAIGVNILRGRLREGGSTLTQQLAKNLFLTQERTLERKLQEVILAVWLEVKFSKAQIIEMYLNRVYFGSGAYGVEAAAQRYFGKSARAVTLSEAAMLAGLVKSPSRLAPTRNPEAAQERALLVLAAMEEAGFITPEMKKIAQARPPKIANNRTGSSGYVADWVMDALNDYVGQFDVDITVQTTIDANLQAAAERALADEIAQKGEKYGVSQGAIVAMDPNGAVRALVGGVNYNESQFNRAVSAKRQPGSAFKPFVYLTALERGMTPDTVRDDAPIQVRGWRPENSTGQYYGPVSLQTALALSLNTVAVRLALEVGPAAVAKTAHRLGIVSDLNANATLALGTSEVSVLELVGAYVPFANGGIGVIPHVIAQVRDAKGKILYARSQPGHGRVIAPPHVAQMNQMLQETLITGTAKRASIPNWPAAGKTGTSQDYRDAWFVGYTGALVTGVWIGNDDSSPTRRASGANLPVDVWNKFMRTAHQNLPPVELPGSGQRYQDGPLVPPADVRNDEPQTDRQADRGIDGWFLDRLFGIRRN
ncbi:MAG: penicillin-binding protein 1A [Xanthobacteraceae bacterium]|nr:penicillin-binding protein 1A [Xanthobacteraceae bacterium]MCW5673373.1 penicillin-binding protein 1A [Xanthobacteraceae bacterium]